MIPEPKKKPEINCVPIIFVSLILFLRVAGPVALRQRQYPVLCGFRILPYSYHEA